MRENKKYQIIYSDPPWYYNDKLKSHGGSAESHYLVMKPKEIAELNVKSIAADNSVLLLWCTYPQLENAFPIIHSWGFKYKTIAFTWIKLNKDNSIFMGLGHYTRANPEVCLLATRGKGIKRQNASIMATVMSKREKHSKKPDVIRDSIVDLFGDNATRIELFAREQHNGWDVWGSDVESENIFL